MKKICQCALPVITSIVATHTLGHIVYGYTLLVPMKQRLPNKKSKERNISGP